MPAFWIVEYFYVIEHVLAGCLAGFVSFLSDPFSFEQMEEALRDRIIVTVPIRALGATNTPAPLCKDGQSTVGACECFSRAPR